MQKSECIKNLLLTDSEITLKVVKSTVLQLQPTVICGQLPLYLTVTNECDCSLDTGCKWSDIANSPV